MSWITTDFVLDTATKLHLKLLRFFSAVLTFFIWAVPACGIWVVYLCTRYSAFRRFGYYISQPASVASLVLFILACLGMTAALTVLCVLSRRLRVMKRVIVWFFLWVPVVNYGIAWYVRGLARQEIDFTLHKLTLDDVRVERQICRTKYPLLLVHGVGFRDIRYFNYWGRIPRELVRNGARVYYGRQEAWATVEDNARILKEQILRILKETGCGKVNIIAHSKGGLDCRYLISRLGMASQVASLTTMNTPHYGSKLVDFLKHLPDPVYRMVCRRIDRCFSKFGDRIPDTYTASGQLSCRFAEGFNRECPDAPGVYYQSYASLMRCGLSSKLLCIPYWVLKALDGPNDGLVAEHSAHWGEFQGVLTNRYLRGISHGDVIDLTREDYRDFKVLEFYVQLVEKLAQKGF